MTQPLTEIISVPTRLARGTDAIPVHVFRPSSYRANSPVLVVMHGTRRQPDVYLRAWTEISEKYAVLLAAPEFSSKAWPGSRSYNLAHMRDDDGTFRPLERTTFQELETVFDAVTRRYASAATTYDIFGHSAGAQFVHRLLMFYPRSRVRNAIAANAGWYTMPVVGTPFPYGLAGSRASTDQLRYAFKRQLVILLGQADTDTQHGSLRTSPQAMAQGKNRLERGRRFFAVGRQGAQSLGVPFAWRIEEVPGAGHVQSEMVPAAARILFRA